MSSRERRDEVVRFADGREAKIIFTEMPYHVADQTTHDGVLVKPVDGSKSAVFGRIVGSTFIPQEES